MTARRRRHAPAATGLVLALVLLAGVALGLPLLVVLVRYALLLVAVALVAVGVIAVAKHRSRLIAPRPLARRVVVADLLGQAQATAQPAAMPANRPRAQLAAQLGPAQAEIARLRTENEQLRADLTDAKESAQLAWDAAASVAPRQRPSTPSRDRLLATPMSGVRPLFPADDGTEQA